MIVVRLVVDILSVVFAVLLWYALVLSGVVQSSVVLNFVLVFFIVWLILQHFKRTELVFSFPYLIIEANVFNKRNPVVEDVIDRYLNYSGIDEVENHLVVISQWRSKCEQLIDKQVKRKCIGDAEKYKQRQLKRLSTVASVSEPFCFEIIRLRDAPNFGYRVRYLVERPSGVLYSYDELLKRYTFLKSIDFACTIREYESKEQRKLMTKELRKKIMIRDKYTCQICGKYMPDEVGLQIDHIVPVAKGGKSIPLNLQVLCSKCNGSKSDKV